MPLPLTVSCFSKIQIGFTFLVPAHPGSPGQRAVKRVCVCVWPVALPDELTLAFIQHLVCYRLIVKYFVQVYCTGFLRASSFAHFYVDSL